MSPKTGRPPIENPKCVRLEIRLTKQESEQINSLSKKISKTRTETILEGIKLLDKQTK